MPASQNVNSVPAVQAWRPPLFPKQWEALKVAFTKIKGYVNLVLLCGPRWSSKTVVCTHIIANHVWETYEANVMVLTLTQSVGTDSGVWGDICNVMQQWIDAGFGMQWVRRPYNDSGTKKPAFIVANKYSRFVDGEWYNVCKVQLDSLKNEDEVEERYKSKRYSMIFMNELSKFKKRKTFDTLKQALRMFNGIGEEDHLFLADTNPDLDLGTKSPWYHLWYEFRAMSDGELEEYVKQVKSDEGAMLSAKDLIPLRNQLRLVEFSIDDNLACSEEKKASLRADFGHDPDLYAAYYEGKWTTASADAIFYKVFRPKFHVRGSLPTQSNPEPEVLVPEENCYELQTGNDPGGTNCASVIGEKIITRRPDLDKDGKPRLEKDGSIIYKEVPVFKLLDELVVVGEDFHLEDFIEKLVEKMLLWEKIAGKPNKIRWTHWSDRSVFDMKVPFSDRYWHQHIYDASGGMISLIAAERGKGSVAAGVDLVRKLLFEERLWISARCVQSIDMFRSIRRGTSTISVIQKGSPFKHVLDAIRYWLQSECYDEMHRTNILNIKKTRVESNTGGFVQMPVG